MIGRFVAMCLSLGLALVAQAQGTRDPTQAPPEAGMVVSKTGGMATPVPSPNYSVIVQDGRPHLLVGSRLVAPGQMVGASKLERITETEVWLLSGKELRKVPRFAGIQRMPAVAATAKSAASECPPATSGKTQRKTSSKPSSNAGASLAGCATAQP